MTTEKGERIYLKAKSDSRIFLVNKGNLDIQNSDEVIFEYDQCQELGTIICGKAIDNINDFEESGSDVAIIRKVNDKDKEKLSERKKEARETIEKCKEKIAKHDLSMNLLDADISFDGKKLTFYFSAPARIDFRALVPDLASSFKKLIRLQQVGARDKAKYCEGAGRCGRPLCCRSFLKGELENISVDMAYDQNLGQMGSGRVTGACGKLMCCLKYELDYYKDRKKKMPEVGSQIKTKEGKGRVVAQNIIKNKITVELDQDKRILEVNC